MQRKNYLRNMILVTGGTGLVGSHLLFELLFNTEATITAIYREDSNITHVETIFSYYVPTKTAKTLYKRILWIKVDILDITDLNAALEGMTHVYHCAAMISYDLRKVSHMRKINIEGTANVVNACLHHKIEKLCYVSSIAALGSEPQGKYITEDSNWNAEESHSAYSWSKYGAEMEVWRASQEGLNVVIVNPGVIIGPGFWDNGSGKLFSKVANGLSFTPTLTTGFVDVFDVVKPMILLMAGTQSNERYTLVSENKSFDNVLNTVARAMDKKPPKYKLKSWMVAIGWFVQFIGRMLFNTPQTISLQTVKGISAESLYASGKIKTELNYSFKTVDESIAETAKHY